MSILSSTWNKNDEDQRFKDKQTVIINKPYKRQINIKKH